ncbi:MAG: argininosuccinate lyase [Firmicutes bacterium]|nr:argininosuccinate lyase [Bacillota bacterium]
MKLWKGRFTKEENSLANEFNASIGFDQRMWKQDITGSMAHAKMLGKQGIIPVDDSAKIIASLVEIMADIEAGKVEFTVEDEDIHMGVEKILTARIGDAGKRLHTARSRNDQVAVDFRLYQKDAIADIKECLEALLKTIYTIAESHQDTVMPGFTHLQKAQPVLLAQHMLAYYNMFSRDLSRFDDCLARTDWMPLGCGALAGTTYNTDRQFLKEELGFANICPNSMDAVSDRDFAIEFLSCCSICSMHLSRFCEELIIWNSPDFGWVEMDDAFSTGSSIMPQKKNPDMAELVRGKTGRVYGDLVALLTVMKGLPLAYNKDMQEDKEPVFDAYDTLKASLVIFTEMLATTTFNKEKMALSTKNGFMNATDAADYLVSKGLPFRECHEIIGKMVLYCINNKTAIEDLSLDELKQFSEIFEADVYEKVSVKACIEGKLSEGSTSWASVKKQLDDIKSVKHY